jgi:uncharacterized protein YbaP (TraB family)
VHVGSSDFYPLDDVFYECFNNSEKLAVELDISKIDQMSMLQKMMYQDTNTLAGDLKPELYNKISKMLFEAMIPQNMANKMKPWGAIVTVQGIEMMKNGLNPAYGIDMHFLNRAKNREKEIIELETVDYQISIFEMFDEHAEAFFEYMMDEFESGSKETEKMMEAWKSGDDKALNKLINDVAGEMEDMDYIFEKLIIERNYTMNEKIEKYLAGKENIFVVVGAGHLIGEEGIVNLLEETGKYTITRK